MDTMSDKKSAVPVELTDCGAASRVTGGYPFSVIPELGWPPFNWQLPL